MKKHILTTIMSLVLLFLISLFFFQVFNQHVFATSSHIFEIQNGELNSFGSTSTHLRYLSTELIEIDVQNSYTIDYVLDFEDTKA